MPEIATASTVFERPVGELGDGLPWQLILNYELGGYGVCCHHCLHDAESGKTFCQRVVRAKNQAGYDSTIVCLRCILEAAYQSPGGPYA